MTAWIEPPGMRGSIEEHGPFSPLGNRLGQSRLARLLNRSIKVKHSDTAAGYAFDLADRAGWKFLAAHVAHDVCGTRCSC